MWERARKSRIRTGDPPRHYRDVAHQLKRLVELVVARLDTGIVSTPER